MVYLINLINTVIELTKIIFNKTAIGWYCYYTYIFFFSC